MPKPHRWVTDEPDIPFDFEVLHEDERIIVIDKPHFLPTTPRGMWHRSTALIRLRERLGEPGITPAHRLDRDTAGVVVFVREPSARGAYQMLFQEHRTLKVYECLAPCRPVSRPRFGTMERLEPPRVFPLRRRSHIVKERGVLQAYEEPGQVNAETIVELGTVADPLSPPCGGQLPLAGGADCQDRVCGRRGRDSNRLPLTVGADCQDRVCGVRVVSGACEGGMVAADPLSPPCGGQLPLTGGADCQDRVCGRRGRDSDGLSLAGGADCRSCNPNRLPLAGGAVMRSMTEGVERRRIPMTRAYTLRPRTGKTHQLRVHMNSLGLPIVGDPMYPRIIDRAYDDFSDPLQLVARTLEFDDPYTGERRCFTSRIPLACGQIVG